MTGRARGRGVARGRGAPASAAGAGDAARRPGSAAAPPASAPTQQAPPANGTSGNGAGRASHRGGARGEPRPGAPVNAPETQFAAMSLGTGDAPTARQGRERRPMSYQEPHTRPQDCADKRGQSGNSVNLYANYFKVESSPDWQMYQYHVDFNPPIDSRKMRKGMLYEHGQKLFKAHLFDGMMLFTNSKLDEITELFSTRNYDGEKIRITIKRTAELSPKNPQCIQIFNIMFRQILSDLDLKEVQRAYFDPGSAVTLPRHKLEIWPGYKTAIAQYDGAVMLNVDLSHKVLRTESVLDVMYELYRNRGGPTFQDDCLRRLVGEIVMTRYNDKTYRIDDIAWDIHPPMTFKRKEDEISYKEYYKTIYNINVRDDMQPMLVSRPKRKDQREGAPEMLYLLPELCNMTGLTDEQRANFGLMKDMGVHTRVDPTKKGNEVMGLRNRMNKSDKVKERLEGWGVQFANELVKLSGRMLPEEKIILGPDGRTNQAKIIPAGKDADWGRDCTRGRQLQTVPLRNWVLVYAPVTTPPVLDNFIQTLRKVCGPMGIDLGPPTKVALQNNSTSAFLEAIRSHVNPQLQMVVCILPTNKKDLYDAIKKQCCVESPVPSQCITNKLISNPRGIMSPVSKIAIQLNCKLGGEAWSVEIPLKKCMVVGIDTYHDSAKKGRSVGGFVASLNGSFTRYYSKTIFQSSMQELIDGLKTCMTAALRKWHQVNNGLPERIMVYRDGVGDGQLSAVFEHECSQILDAAMQIGNNYSPKLTVIVVKKRINTRFFSPAGQNLANPGPGTVIDTSVTRPEWYDFFVVSQSVRQGTVTPTHYNVVYDTSGLRPDHIQRLTYKLCHLYYNWPGTIRVPAPCQYAHKLAFLTGQSIHKPPAEDLADKLYYL